MLRSPGTTPRSRTWKRLPFDVSPASTPPCWLGHDVHWPPASSQRGRTPRLVDFRGPTPPPLARRAYSGAWTGPLDGSAGTARGVTFESKDPTPSWTVAPSTARPLERGLDRCPDRPPATASSQMAFTTDAAASHLSPRANHSRSRPTGTTVPPEKSDRNWRPASMYVNRVCFRLPVVAARRSSPAGSIPWFSSSVSSSFRRSSFRRSSCWAVLLGTIGIGWLGGSS